MQIDGVVAGRKATYDSQYRELEVELGDIVNGQSATVTSESVILGSAAGTTIHNTATAFGSDIDNGKELSINVIDKGIDVEKAPAFPSIIKSAKNIMTTDDKTRVGHILKYTIVVKMKRYLILYGKM